MSTTPSRFFKRLPLIRRALILAGALAIGSLTAPSAHAQWAVHDDETYKKVTTIQENLGDKVGDGSTLNGNLDAIRQKMVIGNFVDQRPGNRVKDPASTLPADTTTLAQDTQCSTLPDPQQANCKKIVEIQNAQYQYMLTMYANSKTRDDMLRAIIADRKNISANDANSLGKLEENTNQLTALYNLIALDQQQMQTVNYAYDANLKFLRDEQARLAREANTGQPTSSSGSGGLPSLPLPGGGSINIGSALGALVTGAVLQGALNGAQSNAPAGYKALSIGKSDGW